ncbi:MAG: SMC-Scp complex subunit ScpB [Acidobacteriota bacterium]
MNDSHHLSAMVEAILFVADRPISIKELAAFLPEATEDTVRDLLAGIAERHRTEDSGLRVEEIAGGYRLATWSESGTMVKEFFRLRNRQKLSRAALETVAIVAYRQPVTHPEIQAIRGVSAEGVLRTLLERRLVRIAGRKDTVGKPLLYGTTRTFLEHFGLASLDDLPPMEDLDHLLGSAGAPALEERLSGPPDETPAMPGGSGAGEGEPSDARPA